MCDHDLEKQLSGDEGEGGGGRGGRGGEVWIRNPNRHIDQKPVFFFKLFSV